MRGLKLLLWPLGLMLFLVNVVPAAAQHNAPAKADRMVIPHVVAYEQCTSGIYADTFGPSCPAVRANPNYKFDRFGMLASQLRLVKRGRKVKTKRGTDFIPAGTEGPDVLISTAGRGILHDDGTPFEGEPQWPLQTRVSDAACVGVTSCTLPDMSFTVDKPLAATTESCVSGKCFEQTTANLAIGAQYPGPNALADGAETNLELGSPCVSPKAPAPGAGSAVTCAGVAVGKPPKTAPAGYYAPRRTGRMTLPFVRAYEQEPCLAPRALELHSAPLDMEGCSEPLPGTSSLHFGPKGVGQITFVGRSMKSGPDVLVLIKIKDVRDASDQPYNGMLNFRTTVRVTHPLCDGGVPCTRPDLEWTAPITCTAGKCKVGFLVGLGLPAGTQSNVEIGVNRDAPGQDNCLEDMAGNKFACPGIYVP